MEILSFFAGAVFFYTKSLYALLFIAIALFFKGNRVIIVWFFASLGWVYIHEWLIADRGMPTVRVIQQAELIGVIDSIPVSSQSKTQFQFIIHRLNNKPVNATVLLACYNHCPVFKAGQFWHLQAKLKVPENLGNPGSYDYQRDLRARHIGWTGYLKRGDNHLITAPSNKSLLVLREQLAESLQNYLTVDSSLGIAQALTLGVTTHMDKSLWELFRRTGTTHLMVISGSHIVLVAGLAYWIVLRLWSLSSRLCLKYPALQAASLVSIGVAVIYTLLAGFAAPAQRSLIACFFMLLPHFISQRFTVWQSWRYAFFAVILYEPHAVLQPGFYLSFLAVAILISVSQRLSCGGIKKVIGLQLACLLGLMPFTLFWFSYGAVNGFIANLIAIPIVGYLIVPLSLAMLFLSQITSVNWLIAPLNLTIDSLLYFLRWVDNFSGFNFIFSFNSILPVLAFMLASVLIFFQLQKFIPAIIVLVCAALFPSYQRVKMGEAEINVLDVGQGLSIAIHTANHTMIYDTGVKFYQGSDMAQMAIIPYLTTLGISAIDKVVISHPDLDHRGGLASLEEKYPIGELLVDNVNYYHRGNNCHQYPDWEWDGIHFHFIPIKIGFVDKNNSSCVLQISNKDTKILLTGDIEKLAENYLLKASPNELAADVLIIAHHGSKTSSTSKFIQQVAPNYAVISAGFDNRYHFPHPQTLKTLADHHIKVFNTAECGMVNFKLRLSHAFLQPTCYHAKNH